MPEIKHSILRIISDFGVAMMQVFVPIDMRAKCSEKLIDYFWLIVSLYFYAFYP